MKKKPLLILMFFCMLTLFAISRPDANANASDTLKKVSYTTRTYNENEWSTIKITPNLKYADDLSGDTNKYKVNISITPIYNSISFSYYNSDDEMENSKITDSQELKQLNNLTKIIYFNKYEYLSSVYSDDGLVSSFSKTISNVTADDLDSMNFEVELPESDDVMSSLSNLSGLYGLYDVQYSVKFQVTASVSLQSGSSLNVKLNKKSISGYVSNIDYLSLIVANQEGKYKIVKAKSSDSSIASINASTGKITMKKTGKCTITVTNAYGKSASFTVTVKPSSISRLNSSITCSLGTKTDLATSGAILTLGTPKYTVKSSKSKVVSLQKSGNQIFICGKKVGSSVLTFTSGKKKFSVRVKVSKARIVLASSITMTKGDSRTLSTNECSDDIYIKKATSIKGLLSLSLSSNARALTLTANKSFPKTSVSEKVIVTFNNGKRKTVKVKITQSKTKKKFSLKDVKIKLNRAYWNGSKSCLKFTVTNNSSKKLRNLKIYYSGILNETVDGYINLNTSIARGKSKTFTVKLDWFDHLDDAKLKIVSAS